MNVQQNMNDAKMGRHTCDDNTYVIHYLYSSITATWRAQRVGTSEVTGTRDRVDVTAHTLWGTNRVTCILPRSKNLPTLPTKPTSMFWIINPLSPFSFSFHSVNLNVSIPRDLGVWGGWLSQGPSNTGSFWGGLLDIPVYKSNELYTNPTNLLGATALAVRSMPQFLLIKLVHLDVLFGMEEEYKSN